MKTHNFIFLCICLLVLMMGISCTLDVHNEELGEPKEAITSNPQCKEWAMAVADEAVRDMMMDGSGNWTLESKVTEAFPVYLLGVSEAPSYFECKVMTYGQDTGYVLVNIDQRDIVIPEICQEGLTLTEQYREKLKRNDIRIYRLDWFSSVAAKDTETKSGDDVLASLSLIDTTGKISLNTQGKSSPSGDIQNILNTFRSKVSSIGCFPMYTKNELQDYYQNKAFEQKTKTKASTTNKYLKHKFNNGHYMPTWYQPENNQGEPVGCAATAYAMAYAYWKQFKGKNLLFDGVDISNLYNSYNCNSGVIYDAMWEMRKDLGTIDINNSGLTLPWEMLKGDQYAESYGYSASVSSKSSLLGVVKSDLVNHVLDQIGKDKPVVLLINSSGSGIPDHYVTVAAAKKTTKKTFLGLVTTYTEIAYYANFGWGGTRKWIYHKGGSNNYSIYESYTLSM
ncbi:MAG: C39 family peptidase [Spirochaetales bacterium]|nr:C39 family peptidase [Spirochaetales bacterium]